MKLIVLKMENQPSVVCDKQITDGFYFYVKAINKRPKVVEPKEQETISEESDEQVTTNHKLADTVILDFLVSKISNEDRICRLLGECLDENGKPLAKRRKAVRTKFFDIEKYA